MFCSAMKLHYGDMTDSSCLVKIISQVWHVMLFLYFSWRLALTGLCQVSGSCVIA